MSDPVPAADKVDKYQDDEAEGESSSDGEDDQSPSLESDYDDSIQHLSAKDRELQLIRKDLALALELEALWWHDPAILKRRSAGKESEAKEVRAMHRRYNFQFHNDELFRVVLAKEPPKGFLETYFGHIIAFCHKRHSPDALAREQAGGADFKDEDDEAAKQMIRSAFKTEYPDLPYFG